jgi:hypothetical protein
VSSNSFLLNLCHQFVSTLIVVYPHIFLLHRRPFLPCMQSQHLQ